MNKIKPSISSPVQSGMTFFHLGLQRSNQYRNYGVAELQTISIINVEIGH